jgi:glycosyltransferase involved in cell wall biosynthesis
MVAPLRYGAGLKGKIGHAFAYGLPTVTTTIGAEGFDIVNGRDALVADDADGLATAIIRAYDDWALWETLSASATRIVERYSPAATERRLAAALEMGFRRRAESVLVATA